MNNTQLKRITKSYLTKTLIENPLLVTFTLKQMIQVYNEFGSERVWGDRETYETNFTHFSNRLNKKAYGNASKRFKKRLKILAIMEGGIGGIRYHYHGVIQTPPHLLNSSLNEKTKFINDSWKETLWGYRITDIKYPNKEVGDVDGWINYISKSRSKQNDLNTSVDWLNTYLG
tara:strand:+ start:5483 stop:6001 length:519 start_codon:yes stop_codon:yes gene_type:complete